MPVRYIPNQGSIREEMLREIGVERIQDLFRGIPEALRLDSHLEIPEAKSEAEVRWELDQLAWRCARPGVYASFLGAGAYRHHVPAAVDHLLHRSEFYSSYTPYQPEVSQGTLQAIFEFQTLVSELTGLPVANASLYDGSTSLAEAVLMADRIGKGKKVLLSRAVHPEYREVVSTYLRHLEAEVVEVPFGEDGRTDLEALERILTEHGQDILCAAFQQPNFFGCVEDVEGLLSTVASKAPKALKVISVTDPYALGLLEAPGNQGADVVCGEMQAFGAPVMYGGPYLGFFATRDKFLRQLPGRLVGKTVDSEGSEGYVLTLSTREQHIRREKATSNICTNQGLIALAATIHMCLLGGQGLAEAARSCLDMACYAEERVTGVEGLEKRFDAPFFHEFVIRTKNGAKAQEILWDLLERQILGGVPLEPWYPELQDGWLITCTELTRREDVERLRSALEEVLA